jgi:N-methylhydantoinase A
MGGTTAKICLIEQQRPKTARTFEVARTYRFKKGSGMPISIPVIEMVEIGAGGGSIAHVDEFRQVRVGPESAGSEPGPACYGRGGERPTVTDADLLLGKLDPARFAGGSMQLFADAARVAVDDHIVRMSHHLTADTAGEEASSHTPENRIVDAAFAVAEVVDENMANAARVHAVENGCELDTYTMIAYGGAAPLHAGRICEKLGIRQFLVPPGAGVGSAIGFLRAPFGYESLRSNVMRLDRFDADAVNALIEDMAAEVTAFVRETGYEGPAHRTLRAYMRYAGQGWEIPVDVSVERFVGEDVPALRESFEKAYLTLFGHTVAGLDAEVVSWALQLRTDVAEPERMSIAKGNPSGLSREGQPVERRLVFDAQSGRFHDCAIYDRESLQVGERLAGPAIIAERETSTLVPPRFSVILQHDGCLLVDRNEGVA